MSTNGHPTASADVPTTIQPAASTSTPAPAQPEPFNASQIQSETRAPFIVVLALENSHFYDHMYIGFNDVLKHYANVERISNLSQVRALFERDAMPTAILAADGTLTSIAYHTLVPLFVDYVRSGGGTLIFMGLFLSLGELRSVLSLLAKFGLPWSPGGYYSTICGLNPDMRLLNTGAMALNYSQKALHISNVTQGNAVYLPLEQLNTGSLVLPSPPPHSLIEVPSAFAVAGAGKVGYVGDASSEPDTAAVILRMCGIDP